MQQSSQVSLGLGIGIGSQGSQESSQGTTRPYMQQHKVEDSLSKLFDDLLAESDTVYRMQPKKHVVTPLLKHQQEALAWMIRRENSNELPPFWDVHKVLCICV